MVRFARMLVGPSPLLKVTTEPVPVPWRTETGPAPATVMDLPRKSRSSV
jgi:hypothetical protein